MTISTILRSLLKQQSLDVVRKAKLGRELSSEQPKYPGPRTKPRVPIRRLGRWVSVPSPHKVITV